MENAFIDTFNKFFLLAGHLKCGDPYPLKFVRAYGKAGTTLYLMT